ncbi:hypothetical protein DPMN_193923 [Dreissena polymorpha]|uniref:VWFA domain-containing protein n=2 Tax=Dreissena polymorpha TaxID=45954 RepID=A0A9D3Y581_DREPO|nr:hypothetical protein DPMN_193923 [Dreissena polymorpha]
MYCACADIDTAACQLMFARNPNICDDPNVGHTACPKFCNFCPLQCYDCNATALDYHQCDQTTFCAEEQVCMLKQLSSFFDGHNEYEMKCEEKKVCDGYGLSFSFGRRDVASRDLSVSCCDTDLCNYPQQPTTTTSTTTTANPSTTKATRSTTTAPIITTDHGSVCEVDLVFVIDESTSTAHDRSDIIHFMRYVVTRLPVGPQGVHVGVGTFNTTSRERFALNDHTSMGDVVAAIDDVRFGGGHGDINAGLRYAVNNALTPAGGDRPYAPNVVVIVTDDGARDATEFSALETELHSKSKNVIVIEVNSVIFQHLSTDRLHTFHIKEADDVDHVQNQVVNLICMNSNK